MAKEEKKENPYSIDDRCAAEVACRFFTGDLWKSLLQNLTTALGAAYLGKSDGEIPLQCSRGRKREVDSSEGGPGGNRWLDECALNRMKSRFGEFIQPLNPFCDFDVVHSASQSVKPSELQWLYSTDEPENSTFFLIRCS